MGMKYKFSILPIKVVCDSHDLLNMLKSNYMKVTPGWYVAGRKYDMRIGFTLKEHF
jgi:hypothetical protein